MEGMSPQAALKDVREFWEENPLFSGEGQAETGSMEWFREWESVYIGDCFAGRQPEPIYVRGLGPETRVLDAGCGPGFWVRHFLRHGCRNVTAFDLTRRAAQLARKSLGLYGLPENAAIHVGNAEQLPYKDASFDHVNCQGVIHHTPDPAACLREFHRVLKPGGSLCFSVYHRNFLLRHPRLLKLFCRLASPFVSLRGRGREDILASMRAEEIVRRYDGDRNPIGAAFTKKELRAMLGPGFAIEEEGRMFFPARALPFRIPKALHRFLHARFGLLVVLRATKLQSEGH